MANLIITEFIGTIRAGQIQAPYGVLASQSVAIGGTTAASSTVNKDAGLLRLFAEADCSAVIAADPDAGTGIIVPLTTNQYDYIAIEPGSSMKVAVITRTVA